jgi:hypothetical protein
MSRLIWNWITGNFKSPTKDYSKVPIVVQDKLFYLVRSQESGVRVLLALRLRSLWLRRQGVGPSSYAAMGELAEAAGLWKPELKAPARKVVK